MNDPIKKLSELAELSIQFHSERSMYSAHFDRVFGKQKNQSVISPRFFSQSLESAIKDLFRFYQGCEAIFVDMPSGVTNIYHWEGNSFVCSTSYNRLA